MTSPELWATVALAAILGCGLLLFLMARSILPMANALSVCEKIDERIDTRIQGLLERVRKREEARKPPEIAGAQPQRTANPIEQIFPGAGQLFEPVGEMPDAAEGVEIRE